MARLVLICDGDDLVTHKLANLHTIRRAPLNNIVIDNPEEYSRSTPLSRDQSTPISCKIYIQQTAHRSMVFLLAKLS